MSAKAGQLSATGDGHLLFHRSRQAQGFTNDPSLPAMDAGDDQEAASA
jgi:hypothetical protein